MVGYQCTSLPKCTPEAWSRQLVLYGGLTKSLFNIVYILNLVHLTWGCLAGSKAVTVWYGVLVGLLNPWLGEV
ncbi:1154_t:CDS:2 [Paraglomus occultum]|uniref:1154_t:CDS:1 n=1 Tax=Paraglomus occultum TaxID=144539 RepID=A0A9N9FID6_9GLOM|nr:1154_t:CDS:2 [Paraglomus occultum]